VTQHGHLNFPIRAVNWISPDRDRNAQVGHECYVECQGQSTFLSGLSLRTYLLAEGDHSIEHSEEYMCGIKLDLFVNYSREKLKRAVGILLLVVKPISFCSLKLS